jgi:hypothetical protein
MFNVTYEAERKAPILIAEELPTLGEAQIAAVAHFENVALRPFNSSGVVVAMKLPPRPDFRKIAVKDQRGRLHEWIISNSAGHSS